MRLTAALLAVAALGSTARADRVVAITPLSTLGAEDKSAASRELLGQIEKAIAALPGTKIVTAAQVSAAIDKAKKPQLKQCEGDTGCVSELGKLLGVQLVVTGEVGGLGNSKVVYLKSTDVVAGRELRSTTLSIGSEHADDSPAGAAVRLLEPDRYRGTVRFQFDVAGANVLVNGTKVRLSAAKELTLPVGTHAVTVTHPQFHNFVKFVDVRYDQTTAVDVTMKQYPIIEHAIQGKPRSTDRIEYVDVPWYRRPYVTGTAIVILAVTVGILASRNSFPSFDSCRKVGGSDDC